MDVSRIAQQKVVLQLMDNVLFDSQGIYNYVVSAVEFNKIKAAEGAAY